MDFIKSLFKNKWFLAALFFAIYSALINWRFSAVLMVSIAFHESGHLWAARRYKMRTGGFYFIPFMGGVATILEDYKTFAQQAYIAIMGPIWGLFLAFIALASGIVFHSSFLTTTATMMAMFNLFNLLPVTFLDGGQTLKTVVLSINKKYGFKIINGVTIITSLLFFYKLKAVLVLIAAYLSIRQTNTEEENYLNDGNSSLPSSLTKKQMSYTIGSYLLTLGLLLTVFSFSLTMTHLFTGKYTIFIN